MYIAPLSLELLVAHLYLLRSHGLCSHSRPIQARSDRNGEPSSTTFSAPQLILLQAIAFFLSIFDSPSYNLPIFLFGIYAQENAEALQSLQTVSNVQFTVSHIVLPTAENH
jgi:hypothetical protein